MKIINSDELDTWLFEHVNNQGHKCDGIKGAIHGVEPGDEPAELVNIKYVDIATGEKFDVIYGDS